MTAIILLTSFFCGTAGALFICRYARHLELIDKPNDRSSHQVPTPRGGGLGILLALVFSSLMLIIPLGFWLPIVLLAAVSFFDDRVGITPTIRLFFHFSAAFVVLFTLKDVAPGMLVSMPAMLFWAFFIVGSANFYNFMDGINGIAGGSGIIGFTLLAFFAIDSGVDSHWAVLSGSIAIACLGFLPFNFPSARVFMGDVGSILLGFLFGAYVALMTTSLSDLIVMTGFLLPFYADASVTLFIRWRKGEPLFQSHRTHLYQILVNERHLSHSLVMILYCLVQGVVGAVMLWGYKEGVGVGLFSAIVLIIYGLTAFLRQRIGRLGDC